MRRLPYDDYRRVELILRDWLAMDRTTFAGTRTFLAYLRAVATAIIATVIFIAIFRSSLWGAVAYFGFVIAAVLLLFGVLQYQKITSHQQDLRAIEKCIQQKGDT